MENRIVKILIMKNIAYCFDLDGTIIKEEILPLLSHEIDLAEEMSLLTDLTMQGSFPFDKSFKLRVKLLSVIPLSRAVNVISKVNFQKEIIDFIKKNSDNCFVITSNLDVWVRKLIEKNCKCNFYSSKANYKANKLLGIEKIIKKGEVIKEIKKTFDYIVAVGDGANDVDMFKNSDISIAYGGIKLPPEVLINEANYTSLNENNLIKILEKIKGCNK